MSLESSISMESRGFKVRWNAGEDELLKKLVEEHGAKKWSIIAQSIPDRSDISCRHRWFNQLSPQVNHHPFTPEEDDIITKAHAKFGNKWATIAHFLSGRTDSAVKDRWNCILRKRKRLSMSEEDLTSEETPQPPLKRFFSTGSGTNPGNQSGSNLSDSGFSAGSKIYRSVARRGGILPLSVQQVETVSPTLSLSLPGFGSSENPNLVTQIQPVTPAPTPEPAPLAFIPWIPVIENRSVDPSNMEKQIFSPEFSMILQDMIRREVKSYMSHTDISKD